MKNHVRRNQFHNRRRSVGKWAVVIAILATATGYVKRRISD